MAMIVSVTQKGNEYNAYAAAKIAVVFFQLDMPFFCDGTQGFQRNEYGKVKVNEAEKIREKRSVSLVMIRSESGRAWFLTPPLLS